MTNWEKRFFNINFVSVALSGATYFFMKYFLEADDPFAVVNHPLQPFALYLHILSAPLFLVSTGILIKGHVTRQRGRGAAPHRGSGRASLWTLTFMGATGYLLQVLHYEAAQQVLVVAHVGSSAAFATAYSTHLILRAGRFRTRSKTGQSRVDNCQPLQSKAA